MGVGRFPSKMVDGAVELMDTWSAVGFREKDVWSSQKDPPAYIRLAAFSGRGGFNPN